MPVKSVIDEEGALVVVTCAVVADSIALEVTQTPGSYIAVGLSYAVPACRIEEGVLVKVVVRAGNAPWARFKSCACPCSLQNFIGAKSPIGCWVDRSPGGPIVVNPL